MNPEQKPRGDLAALRIERDEEHSESRLALSSIVGWSLAIVALAVGAWLAYSRWIAPRRYPAVEVWSVKPTVIVSNPALLTASGYLVADKQATITPKVSGRVIRLNFDTGSRVTAGDVLVVLESDELQAQLREAEASYAEAAREHARQKSLWEQGVSSRALLDAAEAQRDVAIARVERLRVILRDTVVRAPFSGTIIAKQVEIGEMVAPLSFSGQGSGSSDSGSIATLADLRTLEVEADVNENNLAQVRLGQPAEIAVDAFPGKKWRGQLRQVVPTADRAKGSVKVKVTIVDPGESLLPEMSASVSFLETQRTEDELREPARIWIPQTAVASDDGGAYVMLLTAENEVAKRRVSIGTTREGRVEIASGLAEGDRVVAREVSALDEGDKVRIPEQ